MVRRRLSWYASVIYCYVAIQAIGVWSTLQHIFENTLLSFIFFQHHSSNGTTEIVDKVALVTGANRGLGLATAELLIRRGVHTLLLCRSRPAGVAAVDRLFPDPSLRAQCTVIECDLASFVSVRKAASDVVLALMRMSTRLDYIVANAGIMDIPTFQTGQDGYELQMQVNSLSHALLIHLLLKAGVVRSSPDSRILSVSSFAHRGYVAHLDDVPNDPLTMDPALYHPKLAYARSKWCQILLMQELRTSVESTYGIQAACLSLNPGVVYTDMARNYCKGEFPDVIRWLSDPVLDVLMAWTLRRPKTAALFILAALVADACDVDGGYVYMGPTGRIHRLAYVGYVGYDGFKWPGLIAKIDHF